MYHSKTLALSTRIANFSLLVISLVVFTVSADTTMVLDLSLPELNDDTATYFIDQPNMSGVWVLDKKTSDDPEEIMASIRGRSSMPEHKKEGRKKGRRPPSGDAGAHNKKRGKPGSGSLAKVINLDENRIIIQQTKTEISINSTVMGTKTLVTDFLTPYESQIESEKITTISGWSNNILILEIFEQHESKIFQHYKLLLNPRRLERITRFQHPLKTGSLIRIQQIFNEEN